MVTGIGWDITKDGDELVQQQGRNTLASSAFHAWYFACFDESFGVLNTIFDISKLLQTVVCFWQELEVGSLWSGRSNRLL